MQIENSKAAPIKKLNLRNIQNLIVKNKMESSSNENKLHFIDSNPRRIQNILSKSDYEIKREFDFAHYKLDDEEINDNIIRSRNKINKLNEHSKINNENIPHLAKDSYLSTIISEKKKKTTTEKITMESNFDDKSLENKILKEPQKETKIKNNKNDTEGQISQNYKKPKTKNNKVIFHYNNALHNSNMNKTPTVISEDDTEYYNKSKVLNIKTKLKKANVLRFKKFNYPKLKINLNNNITSLKKENKKNNSTKTKKLNQKRSDKKESLMLNSTSNLKTTTENKNIQYQNIFSKDYIDKKTSNEFLNLKTLINYNKFGKLNSFSSRFNLTKKDKKFRDNILSIKKKKLTSIGLCSTNEDPEQWLILSKIKTNKRNVVMKNDLKCQREFLRTEGISPSYLHLNTCNQFEDIFLYDNNFNIRHETHDNIINLSKPSKNAINSCTQTNTNFYLGKSYNLIRNNKSKLLINPDQNINNFNSNNTSSTNYLNNYFNANNQNMKRIFYFHNNNNNYYNNNNNNNNNYNNNYNNIDNNNFDKIIYHNDRNFASNNNFYPYKLHNHTNENSKRESAKVMQPLSHKNSMQSFGHFNFWSKGKNLIDNETMKNTKLNSMFPLNYEQLRIQKNNIRNIEILDTIN